MSKPGRSAVRVHRQRVGLEPAEHQAAPAVRRVLVARRTEQDVAWDDDRDVWWHDLVDRQSEEHVQEAFDSETPLFILYTSGTTGKPKGIFHTSGGFLTQVAYTHKYDFDLRPESDVYWCSADIGWVTGHSYIVYGPLANGATQVMYEGTPAHPSQARLFEVMERYGVTILYTAPTLIRTLDEVGGLCPAKE